MKQKNCFFAVAASMLVAAASFTSCSNQDNIVAPEQPADYSFDEGSLIINGQCESSDASHFWVHEWRTSDAQYDGVANLKWDEETPKNHCVVVEVRSQAEAQAAGNMIADGDKIAAWDSQFFITFGENQALKEKDQIRLTMKVKADEAVNNIGTQAHQAPGAYKHWACIGNVNFTPEWTEFDSGWVTVDGNMASMYTIAFNLSTGNHNRFFFDDMKVEVKRFVPDPEPAKVEGMKVIFWNWGVAKEDQFSVKYFKNYTAPKAEDGAIVVESLDPEKVYTEYDNAGADAKLAQNWDTQFLISLPEPLAKGTKVKLAMKVKADKAASAETQAHKVAPVPGAIEGQNGYAGTYIHYALAGNIAFTTEWKDLTVDFTVPDQADGMQSICLNLEMLREINKYYFDDITVYVEQGDEPFFAKDWAAETSYPYYRMGEPDGSKYDFADGAMFITNEKEQANNWDLQPFIMDWFNLTEGKVYKVRLTMSATAAGKATLNMGTWSAAMPVEFEFAASNDFKKYEIEFPASTVNTTGNDAHILFQAGKFIGTVKIQKVELFEL
jgi:hypothetical protein